MNTMDLVIAMVPSSPQDTQRIIALSSTVEGKPYLNEDDRLPHLTLAMLSVNQEQLEDVINEVADKLSAMTVSFKSEITEIESKDGVNLYWLESYLSDQIREAHTAAMEIRSQIHRSIKVNSSLSQGCIQWMESFEEYALHNFEPHFTLGKGGVPSKEKPPKQMMLVPEVLMLYDNCLCRKLSVR